MKGKIGLRVLKVSKICLWIDCVLIFYFSLEHTRYLANLIPSPVKKLSKMLSCYQTQIMRFLLWRLIFNQSTKDRANSEFKFREYEFWKILGGFNFANETKNRMKIVFFALNWEFCLVSQPKMWFQKFCGGFISRVSNLTRFKRAEIHEIAKFNLAKN